MAFGTANPPLAAQHSLDDRIPILGGEYLMTRANIKPQDAYPDQAIQEQLLKVDFEKDCMNQEIMNQEKPLDMKKKLENLLKSTKIVVATDSKIPGMAKSAKDNYDKLKAQRKAKGESSSFKDVVLESIKAGAKNLAKDAKAFGSKELKKARSTWDNYVEMQKNTLKGLETELKDTAALLTQNPVFVKVLPKNMITRGYQWRQGLNTIDVFDDDPVNSCSENGLYFTDLLGLSTFLKPDVDVWQICIPFGSQWVKDPGIQRKWRANQVVLVRKYDGPDLSGLAKLMNLPDFRIPDLTLPCKTIADAINDLTDLNFDVVFNNEFFDYASGAVDLIQKFPDKADKILNTDRIIGNIPLANELIELKNSPKKGIKGLALKAINDIDPTADIAENLKAQATKCTTGIKEAVNNVGDAVTDIHVGVGVGRGGIMDKGVVTSPSKLAAIKKYGF